MGSGVGPAARLARHSSTSVSSPTAGTSRTGLIRDDIVEILRDTRDACGAVEPRQTASSGEAFEATRRPTADHALLRRGRRIVPGTAHSFSTAQTASAIVDAEGYGCFSRAGLKGI
ncbi:hypothetical protein GCM10009836_29570 [Pseudonocardia ailaonensis]|uniref:Uncharacterized protein n=1 Tax=Pseudonocardia ailaonensis TaxID=367279 RepID=A0ABN2N1R0_9PSEU